MSEMRVKPAAIPLYLFAKAPRAGAVKTRMQPSLSAAAAAELAEVMLARTVAKACANWPGEVALCARPSADEPAFTALAARHNITVTAQVGRDLGARMLHALAAGIARAGAAAVMGCDVPHCPGDVLACAHAALARGENPIGAATDGGFYLLGLQRAPAGLFTGVEWRAATVLAAVRARAAAAGVELVEMPALRDIDRFEDLQWLAGVDPAYRRFVDAATDSTVTAPTVTDSTITDSTVTAPA